MHQLHCARPPSCGLGFHFTAPTTKTFPFLLSTQIAVAAIDCGRGSTGFSQVPQINQAGLRARCVDLRHIPETLPSFPLSRTTSCLYPYYQSPIWDPFNCTNARQVVGSLSPALLLALTAFTHWSWTPPHHDKTTYNPRRCVKRIPFQVCRRRWPLNICIFGKYLGKLLAKTRNSRYD